MQSDWAAEQLSLFVDKINDLFELDADAHLVGRPTEIDHQANELDDELTMLEPAMRMVMNAARPGLGDYDRDPSDEYHHRYRWVLAKRQALQARGIHLLGAEAKARLRPDAPELIADQFHEWVWEAARPLWESGQRQEGIVAAARVINARLQQKLGRRDIGEAALCREAFTTDDPQPGRPRLRFPGDRTSNTWKSRQNGGREFGAGCFIGIRNPVAHEHDLDLPEPLALEQLAAFSLLARWIEECGVEVDDRL